MDADRWRRVEAIYHSALARELGDRADYLAEACGGDEELQREVESLLTKDASGRAWLSRPAWERALSLFKSPSESHPPGATLSESVQEDSAECEDDLPPPSPPPFLWVVRFTALVTLIAFGYAVWLLSSRGAPAKSFGWDQESKDGFWHVTRVDPAGPAEDRLQPGDRLISLNEDPNVARAGAQVYRRALRVGDTYRMTVLRDGRQREVTLSVAAGDSRLASSLTWFTVSLVWCGVALFIGFSRPDRLQARLAFLAATATGLVFLQVGTIQAGVWLWQPLHMVLGYHFFYRFPTPVHSGRVWSVLLGLLYLGGGFVAAVHQPMNWLSWTQGPSGPTQIFASYSVFLGGVRILGLIVGFAAAVGMVAVIARNYRLLADPDQRRRIRWVIYGSIVALVPEFWWSGVAFYEALVGPAPVPLFSLVVCATTVTIPISVAYAVVKHRVLDIKVAVRLGLQYLLAKRALQLLLALPVIALVSTIAVNRNLTIVELVTESTAYLYWIAAAGLSLKFRQPLRQWLDRKFFQEQYDREQVLLGVLDEISKLSSIADVSRFVSEQLDLALHPKSVYLWFRDADEIVLTYSSGQRLASPTFPSEGRLLPLLEQTGDMVECPLLSKTGLSRNESRWLRELGVNLMVPIAGTDERLAGVLMLGEKKSEEPYSAADRRLLRAITKQTAVVRENLQLKAQVGEGQRIGHEAVLDPVRAMLGRTISHYRIVAKVGAGGMGIVFKAEDTKLRRTVALKFPPVDRLSSADAKTRFAREAQAAASLNHPNICTVYEIDEADGHTFIAMEFIEGASVKDKVRAGPLALEEALEIAIQAAQGLQAAHEKGIVHRDIKSANLMVSAQGQTKVMDFGLAQMGDRSQLTKTGTILGTPAYMSPEQALAQPTDRRSDIWSLGVVLHEMLTGQLPFKGSVEAAVAYSVVNLEPEPVTALRGGLPAELDPILHKALAKKREERYQYIEEMLTDLRSLQRSGAARDR